MVSSEEGGLYKFSYLCIIFPESIVFLQNLKKTNPGISFTDVGRVLGEKWKKMSGMAVVHFMQFHRVSFLI